MILVIGGKDVLDFFFFWLLLGVVCIFLKKVFVKGFGLIMLFIVDFNFVFKGVVDLFILEILVIDVDVVEVVVNGDNGWLVEDNVGEVGVEVWEGGESII